MPFFVLIGRTTEKKEAATLAKKQFLVHKGNRKRPHYHCQMCGKPVSKFNMKHNYDVCAEKEMKEVRHQKEKYSKGAVCAKKLEHHKENYDMLVTEDNQYGPVYNIHKAKNCLIMIKTRLQQGNMFKTIDKSEAG